jgi:hypothetical protein
METGKTQTEFNKFADIGSINHILAIPIATKCSELLVTIRQSIKQLIQFITKNAPGHSVKSAIAFVVKLNELIDLTKVAGADTFSMSDAQIYFFNECFKLFQFDPTTRTLWKMFEQLDVHAVKFESDKYLFPQQLNSYGSVYLLPGVCDIDVKMLWIDVPDLVKKTMFAAWKNMYSALKQFKEESVKPAISSTDIFMKIRTHIEELKNNSEFSRCKNYMTAVCRALDKFNKHYPVYYADYLASGNTNAVFVGFLQTAIEESQDPRIIQEYRVFMSLMDKNLKEQIAHGKISQSDLTNLMGIKQEANDAQNK